jgi:glycosyltransferase involved in cell wall biosynthesis
LTGKQKIAFLCHPYHRGGVTRWMADAALAFAKRGLEVYFVTVAPAKEFFSGKGRETLLQLLNKEPGLVKTITAPVSYEFEFGTPAYKAFVYKKLLVQLPPGTPIILSDDQAVWEAAAAVYAAYPMVGVLHADEDHYYQLAERYDKMVAVCTCVSERVHKNARQRLPGFDPGHIYTIPCGINLSAVNFNDHTGEVLQLIYVGRVTNYQKRAGDLAGIVAILAKSGVNFHLHVIGDGDAKAPLEAAVNAEGLHQFVTFYGWLSQKEVTQQLSESDILILTSDFEGTPIAMMEALAAGCGMVGTRVSGIEDYELHPLAADCFGVSEVGNLEEAVKKISKIAAVPKTIRQQSARRIAESEFSMDVCLDKYLNAIAAIAPATSAAIPDIKMPVADQFYSRVLALARLLKVGYFTQQINKKPLQSKL